MHKKHCHGRINGTNTSRFSSILNGLLLLCCFQLFAFQLQAQQKTIDSLNAIIKAAKHDTTLVAAYASLTETYAITNPDTVIPICDKALAIIEKNLAHAGAKEKHSFLTTKGVALSNKGYIYIQRGDMDKAIALYNEAMKVEAAIGDKQGTSTSVNNIATIYFKQGKTDSALACFERGLKLQREIGAKEGIATSLNNIGAIYDGQGLTEKALDYYHQSLNIQEELKNKPKIATCLNNIAAIYNNLGQTDKALDYFNRSLKVRQESDDKRGIAQSLNNIGAIYFKLGQTEKALANYEQSIQLYTAIGNKQGIAYSLNNFGAVNLKLGDPKKALDSYNQSLEIYEGLADKKGIAITLHNIGELMLRQSNPAKALQYGNRSLQIAQEAGYTENIRNAHSLLSRSDSALGNYKEAYVHYKEYVHYRDSISNTDSRKAAVKKQVQYEFEKKEALAKAEQDKKDAQQKAETEKQQALYQAKLDKQALITWFSAGLFLLLLLSAFLIFNRHRLKQRHLFQQQLNLLQKQQAVAVMETQEMERKRIAEDLHDSLGHLLSTAKFNLQTFPENQKHLTENPLQLLNQASNEIRNITFDLMPRTLEEEGLVPALNELASRITGPGSIGLTVQVHGLDLYALEKQVQFNIYRIVQEAVNNILKHANAREITIQLIRENNLLTIMIEDDGRGFDPGKVKNGRGLKNISTRSAWLNGKTAVDSTPGRGTTIVIEIPIAA